MTVASAEPGVLYVFTFGTRSQLEKKKNFGRWITDEPDDGSMNSIQNGILLQSTCHQLFDLFRFSINPMYVVIRYLSTTQLLIVGLGRPQNCLLSRLSIWSFRKMP